MKPGVTYTNQLGLTNELAKMNRDAPHPADGEPADPTDPEVFALSVRHADGRPLALVANYSLHYMGDVGPGHSSADYFVVFGDRIQQLLGADRQDPFFTVSSRDDPRAILSKGCEVEDAATLPTRVHFN